MKYYQYRQSKLLHQLRNAAKSNKEVIFLKILYQSDIDFLEERGYLLYHTNKKHWYKVEFF